MSILIKNWNFRTRLISISINYIKQYKSKTMSYYSNFIIVGVLPALILMNYTRFLCKLEFLLFRLGTNSPLYMLYLQLKDNVRTIHQEFQKW